MNTIHTLNLWGYREKFPFAERCIDSWKKMCPNTEIKVWTENDSFIKNEWENSEIIPLILKSNKFSDYRKRIIISDYLKFCILYNFGGAFIDMDMELCSPISFTQDFSMNFFYTLAACTPVYFSKPKNKILYEILQRYRDVENLSENVVSDWEMGCIETLSEPLKSEAKKILENGLFENVQFTHWITLYKEGDKIKFWGNDVEEIKYFDSQVEFDTFLSQNLLLDLFNKLNYKFIFINPKIKAPFFWSTSQQLKIFKSTKKQMEKYLSYYLDREKNEV